MTSFGDELRRLRRRSGLSQEVLAERAGLSTEAISLLERGRRSPRLTTMRLLADAMTLGEADRSALFGTLTDDPPVGWSTPTPAEPMIGRESELADLSRLLHEPDIRLITVCGPGGVGKTRLSITAAGREDELFPDGVRWLPVSSLGDAQLMLTAIAAALGADHGRRRPLDSIVEHVHGSRQLLVVDNADSRADEVADLCRAILADPGEVKILVTSRFQLRVPGELVYALRPLRVPPVGAGVDLRAYAASRLFLERMSRLDAGPTGVFRTDASSATAIGRICRRLDGLPLALELAAARTGVLTVSELADALDRSLSILSPTRDSSLTEEVVGWSYRLLPPVEQRLFARLGVFSAGFGREDATAVCAADLSQVEVLDALASLVARSLVVRAEDVGTSARFRMLQIVREFARERLDASGGGEAIRERHSRYVLELVERAGAELTGPDQQHWLDQLDRLLPDVRSAVGWLLERSPTDAQRLVGACWRWCYLRGRYAEGRSWTERALAAAPDSPAPIRARALSGAGMLAFLQCEYDAAHDRIESARRLYVELEDAEGRAWCLARLGSIARERGRYDEARRLHEESLALAQQNRNPHAIGTQLNYLSFAAWLAADLDDADRLSRRALETMMSVGDREGTAWSLTNAGVVARYRGDLGGADLLLRQALELSETIVYREGIAWAQNQLGVLARLRGDLAEAQRLQLQSLEVHRELGDRWRMASVLDELAAVAVARGDLAEAVARLTRADRLRGEIGAPVPTVERADRDRTEDLCRVGLGDTYQALTLASLASPPEFV